MSRYTNTSRSIKDITASWPNTLCYLHLPLFSGIFATPLKIMHHVTLLNNTPMATDWSPYNLTRPRSEHHLIAYIAWIIRYVHIYVVYSFVLILLPLLFDSGYKFTLDLSCYCRSIAKDVFKTWSAFWNHNKTVKMRNACIILGTCCRNIINYGEQTWPLLFEWLIAVDNPATE